MSEMFVANVSRFEAGVCLKPGVEQIEGNTAVAYEQQQHLLTGRKVRVGMV